MKERALLSFEGVKHLRVGAVLLSATKITKAFPALKEPNGMVFKEYTVHKKVDCDGVAISVCPYRNLKGNTLLYVEVRNELLEERRADRL